ncbi:MAG: hypothetical protein ACI3Y5_01100 [Prevotella sp.]
MRHITILLAIILNAAPAMSQENVIAAMKRIPKLPETNTLHHVSSTWVADNGDDPATFCRYNELTVKKSDRRLVDDLVSVFMQDRDSGYAYFFKTAGETTSPRILTLVYGTYNQNVVKFGTRDDSNYYIIITTDKAKKDKYIAYGLVWNDEGERLRVKLYHIKGYKSRVSLPGTIPQPDKVRTIVNGRTVTMTSKDKDGRERTRRYVIGDRDIIPTDTVWDGQAEAASPVWTRTAGNGLEVRDDIDFMRLFGNLRVAFNDALQSANTTEGQSMLMAVSTKLLEICKKHHALLSDHEKTVCLTALVDMAKSCGDKFISGMLHEAVMQLTPSSDSRKDK